MAIRQHLMNDGIQTISQISDSINSSWISQAWKSTQDLDNSEIWHPNWNNYLRALRITNIRITEREDEILWALSSRGRYSPKEGYVSLCVEHEPITKSGGGETFGS